MAKPPPRKPKKKVCQFCKDKATYIDYKDTTLLRKFISDRGTGGSETQLRVRREVADDGDDGLSGHGQWTSGRISLVRSTDSLRFSCRSSSATAAGSAWMSTMA